LTGGKLKVKTVSLFAARINLSRLVDQAARGEEIIIAQAGHPLARLVPLPARRGPRPPGLYRNEIHIGDASDDPLPPEV